MTDIATPRTPMQRLGRLLLFAAFLVSALWLASCSQRTCTWVRADYRVYVDAAHSLYEHGDPYLRNGGVFFEFHYRYPPLLALLMPVLRWIWYPLLVAGISIAIFLRYRATGAPGLGLPTHLTALLVSNLFNGNAQAIVLGIGSLGPTGGPVVAVLFAFAAWVKLYPACVLVWWLGRRDWRSIRWFTVAFIALGLVQLPWIGEFVRYSATQTGLPVGLSLRGLGPLVWSAVIGLLAWGTYSQARNDRGWTYCVLLQLAVLPRILLFNLPLLLMAPHLLDRPYAPLVEGSRAPVALLGASAVIIAGATIFQLPRPF